MSPRPRAVSRALLVALGVLACAGVASLLVGPGAVDPVEVARVLGGRDGSHAAVVVREMRVPRTVTALVAGAALGVAGAVMQSLTRNPLADPGLLGVNAGAAFGVVLAVTFVGLGDFDDYVGAAFAGAAVLAVAVLLVDRGPSSSPATVVLAGVAFSAVLTGATTGLALLAPDRFNALRSWVAGSVTGRETGTIVLVAALTAVGLIVTAVVVRPLDQLELGEDLARSLGVPVGASRAGAVLAVTLLAGSATALAGPIVFVGLMVPQVAQLLAGPALGWRVLLSAVLGAALLIAADVVGRLLLWPAETPAGLVTAMLGAPALVLLVRARLGRGGALDTPNRAWAS